MNNHLKRILSVLLIACLMLSLGAFSAFAESQVLSMSVDGFGGDQQVSVVVLSPAWDGGDWYDSDCLIFMDQLEAANGSVDINVNVNDPVPGEYSVIVNGVIYKQTLVDGPALGFEADKDTYQKDEIITLTGVTSGDVIGIGIINENGKWLGKKGVTSTLNEDGSKSWEVKTSIGTKGDRAIGIVLNKGNGFDAANIFQTINVEITGIVITAAPEVFSAALGEGVVSAKVNELFTVNVETSLSVEKVAIFNEYGAGIGKSLISKTISGDKIVWVFNASIGTKGERTLTVKAAGADKAWVEPGAQIQVKIVK